MELNSAQQQTLLLLIIINKTNKQLTLLPQHLRANRMLRNTIILFLIISCFLSRAL